MMVEMRFKCPGHGRAEGHSGTELELKATSNSPQCIWNARQGRDMQRRWIIPEGCSSNFCYIIIFCKLSHSDIQTDSKTSSKINLKIFPLTTARFRDDQTIWRWTTDHESVTFSIFSG
jgi:hypothetical protein